MLVDEAEIILIGGHGGKGKVSFYRPPQKGPDGGNGGKGGDVYIKVTSDLSALNRFTSARTLEASDGMPGGSNRKFGKNGEDLEILFPVGSFIKDLETGEEVELDRVNERILIAKGGKGGKGNFEFKSPSNTTPEYAQPGLRGDTRHLKVTLRFIADVGLIGLPNAGKSSLLNELTNALAKTAVYPFTTLEPNLGVLRHPGKSMHPGSDSGDSGQPNSQNDVTIADIPGLIEGASGGKGLGIKFLKHIQKVKLILHCLSAESLDPVKDYQIIRNELKSFDPELLEKEEIILLTKSDLFESDEVNEKIKKLKKLKKQVIPVSIHDYDSIVSIKEIVAKFT